MERDLGPVGGRCLRHAGRSTNDFWLPVAQRFGVTMKTFGNRGDNKGSLPKLFAS